MQRVAGGAWLQIQRQPGVRAGDDQAAGHERRGDPGGGDSDWAGFVMHSIQRNV